MARLDLTKYNKEAPLNDEVVDMKKVRIMLSQHIGAPATAVVKVGDKVICGKYSGTEVKMDGVEYTIVKQGDILAIVE